jgi:hypothetical protein
MIKSVRTQPWKVLEILESTGNKNWYWKILENSGFSYPVLESTGFLIPLAEFNFFACT